MLAAAARYVTRNIEHLRKDDLILAWDEHDPNGRLKLKRVEEVYVRIAYKLTIVTLCSSTGVSQTLYATHEHPIYLFGRQWTPSRELSVGDHLLEPGGALSTVTAKQVEYYPAGIEVYNIRVADSHTYFVREQHSTAEPVWVHNAEYGTLSEGIASRADVVAARYDLTVIESEVGPYRYEARSRAQARSAASEILGDVGPSNLQDSIYVKDYRGLPDDVRYQRNPLEKIGRGVFDENGNMVLGWQDHFAGHGFDVRPHVNVYGPDGIDIHIYY